MYLADEEDTEVNILICSSPDSSAHLFSVDYWNHDQCYAPPALIIIGVGPEQPDLKVLCIFEGPNWDRRVDPGYQSLGTLEVEECGYE
jgi:hypothetical protein